MSDNLDTNQASEDELKEKLAEIEHERWADWQKWIHLVYENPTRPFEEAIANWKVQIDTPYSKLSDREKASDMEQVDRYWPLVLSFIRTEKLKLLAEVRELLIDRIPVYDGDDSFGKEYQAGYNSMAHATRTMQLQQRAELTKLEAEV
jgi:hypothetical protein